MLQEKKATETNFRKLFSVAKRDRNILLHE